MEASPKKEKPSENENSIPHMDEPDEEKNNEIDKNATDPTDLEKNEDTQHLDELMGDDVDQSEEVDKRSIYVKNVDYLATREEVIEHFKECGKVNRVTILTDKYTGNPKGYAYIEFEDAEGVENAKLLSDSLLRGRQIKVLPKRTNKPFKGKRRPRGSRFGGYGFRGYYRGYSMFSGPPRGRRGFKPY